MTRTQGAREGRQMHLDLFRVRGLGLRGSWDLVMAPCWGSDQSELKATLLDSSCGEMLQSQELVG